MSTSTTVEDQQPNKPPENNLDMVRVRFLKTGRYGDPNPSLQIPVFMVRAGDVLPIRPVHYDDLHGRKPDAVELVDQDEPVGETHDDGSDSDLGTNAGAEGAHKAEPRKRRSRRQENTEGSDGGGE